MNDINAALSRLYGFLGFIAFGLSSIFLGNMIFGLGINFWEFPSSGSRIMLLIPLFLIFAFTGLFIGWGIGASIKIKNHVEDVHINPILLYGANGSFMWMFSFGVLSFVIAKEGAREIMLSPGSFLFFIFLIGICLLGSLLISLMLFIVQYFRN